MIVFNMNRLLPDWGTIIAVPYLEGLSIHPRVYDKVDQELGRICAIDTQFQGIRMSTSVFGGNFEEARMDALRMATHLLSILNISSPTDVYVGIIDRDNPNHYRS